MREVRGGFADSAPQGRVSDCAVHQMLVVRCVRTVPWRDYEGRTANGPRSRFAA